eukprot:9680357-Alexandrium_andersonii.AAC.1
MSASLVGSEMCIRDSSLPAARPLPGVRRVAASHPRPRYLDKMRQRRPLGRAALPECQRGRAEQVLRCPDNQAHSCSARAPRQRP